MSTDKDELSIEDDFVATEDEAEPQVEIAKTNLSKRRTIDNMLEERRLQKQLADFDYDLQCGCGALAKPPEWRLCGPAVS